MAGELKKLVQKRGIVKGNLTRFSAYLAKFETDKNFIELEQRLTLITEALHEFQILQDQIEFIDEDTSNEVQNNERQNFEDAYFKVISKAKGHLAKKPGATQDRLNNGNGGSDSGVSVSATLSQVKLPTISLPEFSGSYSQWTHFYETFNSLIHDSANLSNIQKFHYLKSCLHGEAAQLLYSLEITHETYSIAWDMLKDRYENKKIIIHTHVKALFDLYPIKAESHFYLRKLLDTLNKNLRALKSLGIPVESWDAILLYLIVSKLDLTTKLEWDKLTAKDVSPTIKQLTTFLSERCQLLEASEVNLKGNKFQYKREEKSLHLNIQNITCSFCKQAHKNHQCGIFLKMNLAEKIAEVKKHKLCENCIRPYHKKFNCKAGNCYKCKGRHNSLLCNLEDKQNFSETEQKLDSNAKEEATSVNHSLQGSNKQILLATALVYVPSKRTSTHVLCRALLDGGSQSSFMTRQVADKLGLKLYETRIKVLGINNTSSNISEATKATIISNDNKHEFNETFLITQKITEKIPAVSFDYSSLNIPKNVNLADTTFNVTGEIDILLGANIFYASLTNGQQKLNIQGLMLQNSLFGWVIIGPLTHTLLNKTVTCNLGVVDRDLNSQIEKFWLLEECTSIKKYTPEEIEVEKEFIDTFRRDHQGRFEVTLPVKENVNLLGDSEYTATKFFYKLERRLALNPELRNLYIKFMREYEDLGHMTEVDKTKDSDITKFYLPHHGVVKENSTYTKLRVVFNGSHKSNNNLSLNDVLKVGPIIQRDLFSVLLKFRRHVYVIIADIEKMYRQVNVKQEQRDLQRIVWRESSDQELKHYRLNTLTYGTGPASYLAIRSLIQIAIENKERLPEECEIILKDFYVDNLTSGTDSIEKAISIKNNIYELLKSYGFNLREWRSNCKDIVTKNEHYIHEFSLSEDNVKKTLGLAWNSSTDMLNYSFAPETNTKVTKRSILSKVSKIFDPLGLVAPVIVQGKIIIQSLWKLETAWDSAIPQDIRNVWNSFYNQLKSINNIIIPRQVIEPNYTDIEMHVFCDASIVAYGACVYIRTASKEGRYDVRLLCAKSRIAPLKTITLPRLELCGAVLAVRLANKAETALDINLNKKYFWSDSTIVLAWIAAEPIKWKTFVATRVTEIQELSDKNHWRHIPTELNPSDILSRGATPQLLKNSKLWWQGPEFLTKDEVFWPKIQMVEENQEIPEAKRITKLTLTSYTDYSIFERYSDLHKLQKVTALLFRFTENCKKGIDQRQLGFLTELELNRALYALIKLAQAAEFEIELLKLKAGKPIPKSSKLLSLNPFIDELGMLRVGGRIAYANEGYDKKFPILLPEKHTLTKLIIRREHLRNLHAGCQLMLSSLRHKFWPINGKSLVKRVLRECHICFRVSPKNIWPQMGNLPPSRVSIARPFSSVGIDMAGPFLLKDGTLRTRKIVKTYMCIFVCFITRAIHLELCADLSTEAFLNSCKRFISRRGLCQNIYTDNGSNFVGASNELKKLIQPKTLLLQNKQFQDFINKNSINWHFIPPRSPHMGGLWEAAVKSAKYHIVRVVGKTHLHYEQFYTVLCQIEAVLNSRPLIPLSNDPSDLVALTPGHFLIGDALNAIPQENIAEVPQNRLKHYKLLQSMVQHFWRRWSSEYLTSLQQRSRWKTPSDNKVAIGSLVVLKEDNTPPLHWKLGRIVDVHPGNDDIVRVVSVLTSGGVFKRCIAKVCVLPNNS